jgi:hypothetical protein
MWASTLRRHDRRRERSAMPLPTKPLLLSACALASVALAACGGSGANANATASGSQDNEQRIVNFARCMREHGVNISTPNGTNGPMKVTGTNPQVMEAAQKACARYRPGGGKVALTPAERAAREDALRNFARCMRAHGIELKTETRNGGGAIGIHIGGNGVNPQSPAFQAAQKACEGYLPTKLRQAGSKAGPGPGSGGGPTTGQSSGSASGSAGPSLGLSAGG